MATIARQLRGGGVNKCRPFWVRGGWARAGQSRTWAWRAHGPHVGSWARLPPHCLQFAAVAWHWRYNLYLKKKRKKQSIDRWLQRTRRRKGLYYLAEGFFNYNKCAYRITNQGGVYIYIIIFVFFLYFLQNHNVWNSADNFYAFIFLLFFFLSVKFEDSNPPT